MGLQFVLTFVIATASVLLVQWPGAVPQQFDPVTFAFSQNSQFARFGSVAQGLTSAEFVQVTDLANKAGQAPWLVLGLRSLEYGLATLTVYLEPDVESAAVQRGRMLSLVADQNRGARGLSERSAWRARSTRPYACIAAPGRRPGDISSERDLGWPFAVVGELDDETLTSLVTFIRSRPPIPGVPVGLELRQVAGSPIFSIAHEGDRFTVTLRTGDATFERVTVARADGQWVIASYDAWIV